MNRAKLCFPGKMAGWTAAVALSLASFGVAAQQSIVMASTTSTEQSGLFGHLLPRFQEETGIKIKVVAQGTGQALDMARRGDADVLFVHDKIAEEKFVADGFSKKRYPVMYNDFVLVGPKDNPAGIQGNDLVAALKALAESNAAFVSRGDKSGTHSAELRYWKAAGVEDQGSGYKPCGCGMGPALNIAASTGAYVLSDRATWLNFKNKADLQILVEGDERMFNQYGVMVVNPEKFSHVKAKEAQRFVDWITSEKGQKVIADYTINGEPLFFPNADQS